MIKAKNIGIVDLSCRAEIITAFTLSRRQKEALRAGYAKIEQAKERL